MQILLQVTFQGCRSSDAVSAETHDHHITSGRATVIGPSDQHRHGEGLQIHILLTVPPNENAVVSHSSSGEGRHEHAKAAVKDAFAAARRQ